MSRRGYAAVEGKADIMWQAEGRSRTEAQLAPAHIINFQSISYQRSRSCSALPRPHWKYQMQTIEITNPLEARRCRYAQYRGQKARLILNGVPVTGMIRAVKEDKSSTPMRWTVTVVKLATAA
jgi:hypothetical protein